MLLDDGIVHLLGVFFYECFACVWVGESVFYASAHDSVDFMDRFDG